MTAKLERTEKSTLMAIGFIVLGAVTVITFYPSTKIGFFGDDWWQVANAGRMSLPQFLRFYFDPTIQTIWYRPLHGVLLLAEYTLFGSNAENYHLIYTLVHLANSCLLFAVVYQISGRWRLAFISAIFFAVLFPGSTAVFGIAVHDPLAGTFYLLTTWLWFIYLKTKHRLIYFCAIGSFVLALMSKETSLALIVTLFLIDRIFAFEPVRLRDLFRRYSIFIPILIIYLAIEYQVQLQGHFANRGGYSIGFHVIENLLQYLGLMLWPWGLGPAIILIGLACVLILLLGLFVQRRQMAINSLVFLFLAAQAFFVIVPVLGFPRIFFEPRYLYPASVVPSILIAILFEQAWKGLVKYRITSLAALIGLVFWVLLHSFSTANAGAAMAEFNREARAPFRDIVQQHPTFEPDTLIYLIDPPYLLKHAAPSMFFFRYGKDVSVWSVDPQWWGTIDDDRFANWRNYRHSFVYYYDEAQQRHEIIVEPLANSISTPSVPLNYAIPVLLKGYELTNTIVTQGNALVLLLYWQAQMPIDKDYTVFVHLVDQNGQVVAGNDSQPQDGQAPTSKWKINKLIVDPHILKIDSAVPAGNNYRLEIGLYYLPTLERVGIVDTNGNPIGDTLVISSFRVVE